MEIIKVSSKSNPNSVASAISNIIKKDNMIDVQVVGAGALNQLVKAIIICRGYLAPLGISIVCVPSFVNLQINESVKTGIRMQIYTT